MTEADGESVEPVRRSSRPSVDVPRSVLDALSTRIGTRPPRVSLREEDPGEAGEPPVAPGAAADERAALPEGRGTYQVLGEIARGGMGVVLRSHDVDLGRDVAMKVLAAELADRPEVVQRFVEEAQIGGQLQHPGIVPVYELGLLADERPYFTMKLVKGRTLARLLADRRAVDADRRRLVDVFESVCQTMAYAHSRGVIHRDLKPANVMVGAFGEVQVVDWGLAKVLPRGGRADEKHARRARTELTVLETVRSGEGSGGGSDSLVGSVLGTPAYMPPEQARGNVDRLDERSDVFALGAILCEILTGAPPYAGEAERTLSQAAQAELDDALARLAGCGADPELVRIAERCLVAAPGARPRDAGVLAESVRAHLETTEERARAAQVEAAEARVLAAEERKARKLTIALAVSLLAVLLLGGGGWAWKERRERDELARLDRGLEDLRAQVAALQDEGRPDEALQVARNALVLVDGRAAGDELRARAEEFVARARAARDRAEERRVRIERDQRLLRELDALRLEATKELSVEAHAELDARFAQAFREWGLDVDADILESLRVMRESELADELAPALDDWASVRRWAFGWRSFEAEAMSALAADLDPDPLRLEMREALIDRDRERLLAIAALPEVDTLPASSAWVLGNALKDLRDFDDALTLLADAVSRHPDDLRLRVTTAAVALDADRPEEALPHVAAAAALRPDLAAVAGLEGSVLRTLSRYPAGIRAHERALALDPEPERAVSHVDLGHMRFQLGDFVGAVRDLEAAEGRPEFLVDSMFVLEVSRALVAGTEPEELKRRMLAEGDRFAPVAYALYVLVQEEPGPIEDADAVLESLPDPPNRYAQRERSLLVAQIHAHLGRAEDTLEVCRRAAAVDVYLQPAHRVLLATLRARAWAALGNEQEARAWLTEATRSYADLVSGDLAAWERSLLRREVQRAVDAVP